MTTRPSRQVYDKKFQSTVTADVTVTVRLLPREAVTQSGSLRVAGVTAERFVTDVDRNVSPLPSSGGRWRASFAAVPHFERV